MDSATKERAPARRGGRGNRWEKLVESGLLTADALADALAAASSAQMDPARFLLENVGLRRGDVEAAVARHFGCSFYRFSGKETVLPDLRPRLPFDFLKKMCGVPVERRGAHLIVVVDDPLDSARVEALRSIDPDHDPLFQVGFRDEILACIEYSYGVRGDARLVADERTGTGAGAVRSASELADRIVIEAHRRGASDVHIEPNGSDESTVIRLRVGGAIVQYQTVPPALATALVARLKSMAGLQVGERQRPQEGTLEFRLPDRPAPLHLRVTTLPTVHGNEDVVMRLSGAGKSLNLDQLGLGARNLAELQAALRRPEGLFLCVGPSGAGKTTTLHAALGHLNSAGVKIWTAEEPVEITQPGLRQVAVQPKIGFDFVTALRSIVRADADVIMIGEVRDEATAAASVDAALGGHLVLAGMLTSGAPETISRLADWDVDRYGLARALVGVLAQRLVRGLCPGCRQPHAATPDERAAIAEALDADGAARAGLDLEAITLWRAPGCPACGGTGEQGWVALHELLVVTNELEAAIVDGQPFDELRRLAVAGGMIPLVVDGIGKAASGQTDLSQVLLACSR